MARISGTKSEIHRVYAYYGADDGLKRTALEKLTAEIVDPDFRDFDLEALYGPDVTADRLTLAFGVVPFASKRRLVVITQANDVPTPEQQTIADRLDRIPESACVVFVTPAPEMQDGKPKRGSEIHPDLMKAVRKVGKRIDFPLMKADSAVRLVHDLVQSADKAISPSAAAALVRRCGTDSGVIQSEVAKLVDYLGERKTITDVDVQHVSTETVEEKIFALMDAIGSRKVPDALRLLRPLLSSGGASPQGEVLRVVVMLARHFRQLWQARVLMDSGCRLIPPGQVPEHLEDILTSDSILKKPEWQLKKIAAQAKNFSLDDMACCFERINATDLAIKGIEGKIADPALALEMLIIEISTPHRNAGRGRHNVPPP